MKKAKNNETENAKNNKAEINKVKSEKVGIGRSKKNIIQWHPGFCSAMELTLRKDRDNLTFERERLLSRKPLQIDFLIMHKNQDIPVKSTIGHIFKKINIFEYKSTRDALNIDTFYKVMAYGCLYKSESREKADSVSADDITLSIVRASKPVKFFERLEKDRILVDSKWPGIDYLKGEKILFDTQIIVSDELDENEYIWLCALSEKLKEGTAEKIISDMKKLRRGTWESDAAESVLKVAVSANENIFDD